MNPLDLVQQAYLDWYYNNPEAGIYSWNPRISVSPELRDACVKYYEQMMPLKPMSGSDLQLYAAKTGLVLAGKDCVVDPNLKGLSAYTRY